MRGPHVASLAVSVSLDNFSIGFTLGVRQVRHIPQWAIAVMAAMNAATGIATMLAGSAMWAVLPVALASRLGSFIFIGLAMREFVTALSSLPFEPPGAVATKVSSRIGWAETVTLGMCDQLSPLPSVVRAIVHLISYLHMITSVFSHGRGLCLTNIAGGIAAGLAKFPLLDTACVCFFVSHALMAIGQELGAFVGTAVPMNERALAVVSAAGMLFVAANTWPSVSSA